MRFICDDCGREFDEPDAVYESRGEYWGEPCWEEIPICPHCGGSDFSAVSDDELCEEYEGGVLYG